MTGHYRRFREWTLNDPEVRALFDGLFITGKNVHFRIDEHGDHVKELIGLKLMALGMSRTQSTKFINQAKEQGLIQSGEYKKPPKKDQITISVDDPRVVEVIAGVRRTGSRGYSKDGKRYALRGLLMQAAGVGETVAKRLIREAVAAGQLPLVERPPKAQRAAVITDEPEEEEPKEPPQTCERFQLVKTTSRYGTYWGVYDADFGYQELISTDKREALREIGRRIAAEKMDREPYYARFTSALAA